MITSRQLSGPDSSNVAEVFLAYADHHIGRLLDYLEESGQPVLLHRRAGRHPAPGAEGVLFAHGSRFGGHALYVKDGRLHYVYNFFGITEQKIDGAEDIPAGENLILSASFDKESSESRPSR